MSSGSFRLVGSEYRRDVARAYHECLREDRGNVARLAVLRPGGAIGVSMR